MCTYKFHSTMRLIYERRMMLRVKGHSKEFKQNNKKLQSSHHVQHHVGHNGGPDHHIPDWRGNTVLISYRHIHIYIYHINRMYSSADVLFLLHALNTPSGDKTTHDAANSLVFQKSDSIHNTLPMCSNLFSDLSIWIQDTRRDWDLKMVPSSTCFQYPGWSTRNPASARFG